MTLVADNPDLEQDRECDELAAAAAPPPGRAGLLRPNTLADSVAILLTLTVVQRLVGFGRSILFCVWLDHEQLGQWDMALGFILLAAPLAILSLPGSFGRYVAYYRQRGQLRMLLRRVGVATAVLALLSISVIAANRAWFAEMVFGRPDQVGQAVLTAAASGAAAAAVSSSAVATGPASAIVAAGPAMFGVQPAVYSHAELILVLAVSLLAVIGYNFVAELFTALRLQRLASGLEFFNSLMFAVLGIALLTYWPRGAMSVVAAFGGACALSILVSLRWLLRSWRDLPQSEIETSHSEFWGRLLPFVAWLWVSNALANLFLFVDRIMIVHASGRAHDEALEMVGQIHSSRVVPLLLVTVASLLANTIVPFMSQDWESGRRANVSRQLNTFLKLSGLGLMTGAVLVLVAAPLLFDVVFRGKFAGGEAVLSWALMFSTWFGMMCIAKIWLWCDEMAKLVGLAWLAGLLVNIGLNWILLPRLGLLGAALGTCAAHLVALLAVYLFAALRGMRFDRGTWLATALPLALCLGPWGSSAVLIVVGLLAWSTDLFFTRAERRQFVELLARYAGKLRSRPADLASAVD